MPAPIKYILEDITTLSHFELSNYNITGPKEGKNKGPELEPRSTPPPAPTILFKEPGMLLLYFENAIVAMFHLTGPICKQLYNPPGTCARNCGPSMVPPITQEGQKWSRYYVGKHFSVNVIASLYTNVNNYTITKPNEG